MSSPQGARPGRVIIRQKLATRITHWIWATCLFFLLLSGLQIFNAHPTLHIGRQAGFEFDNAILDIGAEEDGDGYKGVTTVFGRKFETTGFLGLSGDVDDPDYTAFPGWLTIPSSRDLATGRVVHFFFAWILVTTLLAWLFASLRNRHLRKDLLPKKADAQNIWQDVKDHARLKLEHKVRYSPLQKLAYGGVLFVLLPLIILTGLCMSPGMNAVAPWLPELFGGRQSARTVHFIVMVLLVGFFVVHMAMIVLAGPINELRSIITGRYQLSGRKEKSNV